ncbi:hypothetical protein EST38_g6764 [Candolleomyces aberdarensis]|uniref:Uncharacterized protein n=1 Tax=Candolleomyces aberdarensis TaxID=2316362 RepID=A0A4Q2DIW7_9AGAR|nr:hypothetical protein EST38_g6764 [Candolleomyces aberdarensis]
MSLQGKRPRRSGGSTTGELTPTAVWRESKKPRILSRVHTTLQDIRDPTVKSARRNELSREEKAVLDELATATSPRSKHYPNIGKGRPSRPIAPLVQDFGRIPTVSHMIEILEKEFIVSDTDDEDDAPGIATTSNVKLDGDTPSVEREDSEREDPTRLESTDSDEDDEDWTDDEEDPSCPGSSDKYSVEDESLGYITSEDGSVLGEVVSEAILEASLEDLKISDNSELAGMDRAKKRNILQNVDLAYLRRLQLKKLIDEIDVGTVLMDRLDQDLRRHGLTAASLLRMMELTDTLLSGSFVHPVLARGILIPNDIDLFTDVESFGMVLSYLKKKGYSHRRQIYPQPQSPRRQGYGMNLQGIRLIFELRNKKAYKVNVIVSSGRPLLPILQFHSTPVMNYISHHGVVLLYDITLYQFGIVNRVDPPARVQRCLAKYERRGFDISDRFWEEHTCRIDGCCSQTIRSLFDRDVVHVRFPDMAEIPHDELRKREANIAVWRLASGAACKAATNDTAGFAVCDSDYSGKQQLETMDDED